MKKPPANLNPLTGTPNFQKAVVTWFQKNGRHYLPWRKTNDPYAVLVSEIMLQQTQVNTVLERGYFNRWMERFPDPATLAVASEADILKAWEGLGYYNRARNLHKAAGVIANDLDGRFPETASEIAHLPGVGRYTAGAIASIAFGKSAAVVDGNVIRILSRLFDYSEAVDTTVARNRFWSWAEELIPEEKAGDYNAGLMELGQRICTRSAPDCGQCPVARFCTTRDPDSIPRKKSRQKTVLVVEHVIFAEKNGKLLLEKEDGRRRKGLWKLPLLDDNSQNGGPVLLESRYSITHHRVDLIVEGWIGDPTGLDRKDNRGWFDIETELPEIAMPSPFRKAVETILRNRREAANFTLISP